MVEKLNSEEYRKQLKEENERKRSEPNGEPAGEPNPDTSGHPGDSTFKDGYGVLSVSGQSVRTEGQLGHSGDSDRKSEPSSGRVSSPKSSTRSVDRRSRKDSSKNWADGSNISGSIRGAAKVAATIRQEGNLIATEEIPQRDFFPISEEKPAPKVDSQAETSSPKSGAKGSKGQSQTSGSAKQTIKSAIQAAEVRPSEGSKNRLEGVHWLDKGKTLTKAEAQELKEPLTQALKDDLGYFDQWLLFYTHTDEPIWSDADDEEIGLCVRILLKQGMKNAAAAEAVRAAAEGSDYLSFMMFSIPRLHKTWMAMKNRPRKTKKRNERENVSAHV